jgi:hypothetical protein
MTPSPLERAQCNPWGAVAGSGRRYCLDTVGEVGRGGLEAEAPRQFSRRVACLDFLGPRACVFLPPFFPPLFKKFDFWLDLATHSPRPALPCPARRNPPRVEDLGRVVIYFFFFFNLSLSLSVVPFSFLQLPSHKEKIDDQA